jgi:hypothetical protein
MGASRPRACVVRTGIHARAQPGPLVVPRHFSAPVHHHRPRGRVGRGQDGQWEWGPLDQRVQIQSFSWCMQPREEHRTLLQNMFIVLTGNVSLVSAHQTDIKKRGL